MQTNEPHAVQHARLNAVHDCILYRAVGLMSPPDEHVGLGEHRFCQTVLRFVQGGGLHR